MSEGTLVRFMSLRLICTTPSAGNELLCRIRTTKARITQSDQTLHCDRYNLCIRYNLLTDREGDVQTAQMRRLIWNRTIHTRYNGFEHQLFIYLLIYLFIYLSIYLVHIVVVVVVVYSSNSITDIINIINIIIVVVVVVVVAMFVNLFSFYLFQRLQE